MDFLFLTVSKRIRIEDVSMLKDLYIKDLSDRFNANQLDLDGNKFASLFLGAVSLFPPNKDNAMSV